jgi:hypothetical protein
MVRDGSPRADTNPSATTSDSADGAPTASVEPPTEEQVNANTNTEETREEDEDDDDSASDPQIIDETFRRLAPRLLWRMLLAGRGGFSTGDLAKSMGTTSGNVLAVARRLLDVLAVGHKAGPGRGSDYVFVPEGRAPDVEARLKQIERDARRARRAAKKATSSPDLGWLDRALDAEGDMDGDPTPSTEQQPTA